MIYLPRPHPVTYLYFITAARHLTVHVKVPLPLSPGGILGDSFAASGELIPQIVSFLDEALILPVLLGCPGDCVRNRIDKFVTALSTTLKVRSFFEFLVAKALALLVAQVKFGSATLVYAFLCLFPQDFKVFHLLLVGHVEEAERVTKNMLFYKVV